MARPTISAISESLHLSFLSRWHPAIPPTVISNGVAFYASQGLSARTVWSIKALASLYMLWKCLLHHLFIHVHFNNCNDQVLNACTCHRLLESKISWWIFCSKLILLLLCGGEKKTSCTCQCRRPHSLCECVNHANKYGMLFYCWNVCIVLKYLPYFVHNALLFQWTNEGLRYCSQFTGGADHKRKHNETCF